VQIATSPERLVDGNADGGRGGTDQPIHDAIGKKGCCQRFSAYAEVQDKIGEKRPSGRALQEK
jgi:hypothetical protein